MVMMQKIKNEVYDNKKSCHQQDFFIAYIRQTEHSPQKQHVRKVPTVDQVRWVVVAFYRRKFRCCQTVCR